MKSTTMSLLKAPGLWLAVAATLAACLGSTARAVLVSDFFTLRGTTATTLSGTGNTGSPSLGTTSATSAGARMIGYFPQQQLYGPGDSVTLSFSLTMNDGATYGSGTSQVDNFRFALFDRSGEATQEATNSNIASTGSTNVDTFRGYWFGVKTASTGAQGSIRERNVVDNDPFANLTNPLLGNPTGSNVVFTGLINGAGTAVTYTGVMTLTLTASGIDLSGSFSGNGGTNTYAFSDTTPVATMFGAVGFLNGSTISADQVNFQNIDVTFSIVPEAPSIAAMSLASSVLGAVVWARRRRAG